jgi:hypothetical protein
MGFDRAKAEAALRSNGYDLEGAAISLLAGSPVTEPSRPAPPPAEGRGRYGEIQAVFDSLTPTEKRQVEKLAQACRDHALALQVYMACDKNESAARELLC